MKALTDFLFGEEHYGGSGLAPDAVPDHAARCVAAANGAHAIASWWEGGESFIMGYRPGGFFVQTDGGWSIWRRYTPPVRMTVYVLAQENCSALMARISPELSLKLSLITPFVAFIFMTRGVHDFATLMFNIFLIGAISSMYYYCIYTGWILPRRRLLNIWRDIQQE